MQSTLEQVVLESPIIRQEVSALVKRGYAEKIVRKTAKKYLSEMGRDINTASLAFTLQLVRLFLRNLDIKVIGNTAVFDHMQHGGVALVSSHFSYVDIGIFPKIFAENGVSDVYYMGGENVYGVPILGFPLKLWLTTSGMVPIIRNPMEERVHGQLYRASVNERGGRLLERRKNLVNYAGRGRHNTGLIKDVELTATPAIIQHASIVYPVAVTYEKPPEEDLFLLGKPQGGMARIEFALESYVKRLAHQKKSASILTAFAVAWENARGEVYVNFGSPIEVGNYNQGGGPVSKDDIRRFHLDLTSRVKELVTLTPNNVFAYAVKSLSESQPESGRFDPVKIGEQMRQITMVAREAGMAVSSKLRPEEIGFVAMEASQYFTALSNTYRNSPDRKPTSPIDFYANQISEPLSLLLTAKS